MMRNLILVFCLFGLLAGCSSGPRIKQQPPAQAQKPGGYYLDDGPGDNPPPDLMAIPDAVPRTEPLRAANMRPYDAMGMHYVPTSELGTYREEGVASWYGRRYHGKPTASGEIYDMYGMTAAHPTLPIPSYARVTSMANGRSVIVRINDRGPFHSDRLIDLSYTAAYKLGVVGRGSTQVRVESLDPSRLTESTSQSFPAQPQSAAAIPPLSGLYLQVGAFGSEANARKFMQRAQDRLGIANGLIRVALINELHRVNLGPFQNDFEAVDWAGRVREALEIDPVRIRY